MKKIAIQNQEKPYKWFDNIRNINTISNNDIIVYKALAFEKILNYQYIFSI